MQEVGEGAGQRGDDDDRPGLEEDVEDLRDGVLRVGRSSWGAERNRRPIAISRPVGARWKASRYIRAIRPAGSDIVATSGRPTNRRAISMTNGLFIRNRACNGVVLRIRFGAI